MPALFVEQLTVIDFAYFHHQRGILGESWLLDVTLFGQLDQQGMIFDFSDVKRKIKAHVDTLIDHKFLFPAHYARAEIKETDQQVTITVHDEHYRQYMHESPKSAVALIPVEKITVSELEVFLQEQIYPILPENVEKIHCKLRCEHIEGYYYHYAHGLKKHLGDCQRIAHGHRSKISIWKNHQAAPDLEKIIAEQYRDIYLYTAEDLVKEYQLNDIDYLVIRYQAQQGTFELHIPKQSCLELHTDTTVELIAQHIAQQCQNVEPDAHLLVKTYEGVQKGAIAELNPID